MLTTRAANTARSQRPLLRRVLVAVFATLGLLAAIPATQLVNPPTAAAFSPAPIVPFATGQAWYVCQGYNGTISHSGAPVLDLTTEPNSQGPTGCKGDANHAANKTIHAPITGNLTQVSWFSQELGQNGYGVCITSGSQQFLLIHLNSSGRRANGAVTAGDPIGTVAPAGQSANGNYAHLHLEARNSGTCWSGQAIPFDDANGAHLQGAPNMTNNGTANQWSGTKLEHSGTGAEVPHNRIGALLPNGRLLVKEGSLDAQWTVQADGVTQAVLSGNRIGALLNDGSLVVKEGPLDAQWVTEIGNVAQGVLSGNRIGALLNDGSLVVKEGPLDAQWVTEIGNVAQAVLSGNRIGALLNDGSLVVKEGPLDAQWVTEIGNVTQAVLSGNRIGALLNDGSLVVKEGPLDAQWVTEIGNVTQAVLSGNRIGALLNDGNFVVKEGPLDAQWVTEIGNVKRGDLIGTRIGVTTNDGAFVVKEGSLNAQWVTEHDQVRTGVLSSTTVKACLTGYSDVPSNHPYCTEIKWVTDQKIAQGYGNGTYGPQNPVTRQEMAVFIMKANGGTPVTCTKDAFTDVPKTHNYCPAITWLVDHNITTGYNDGSYGRLDNIQRQQMAVFLMKSTGATAQPCTTQPFNDVTTTSPYCGAITWLKNNNIATADENGNFNPTAATTREIMAAWLYRLLA